jgi:ectoine hydroxylase-related dioxygenase (phytanoyl-CoA dioxygenase family)
VNKLSPFSLLLGVALTNQTEDFCGNFVVYPGSHFLINKELFSGVGLELGEANKIIEGKLPERLLKKLKEPLQLHLSAGDAVLCHYQLVHGVSENRNGFEPRINLYWRIKHINHNEKDSVVDLFRDFDAIN